MCFVWVAYNHRAQHGKYCVVEVSLKYLCVGVDASVRGEPRRDGSDPLQQMQGLHVSLHAVHRWGPAFPVRLLQLR